MRILHIIPSLRKGGAERIAMDMCAELADRKGLEVKLVYLHNIVDYDIAGAPYEISNIPSSATLSLTKKAQYNIAALNSFIQTFKPDVIHTHLFEAEVVSRSITYPQAKWFTHCHDNMRQFENFGLGVLGSKKRLTQFYEKQYILKRYRANGGNTFITISASNSNYFKRVLPADLRRIELLNNAISTSKFKQATNYERKRSAAIELVTTGTLDDNKNHTFLLDVVKGVKAKHGNVVLHVLGDGPNMSMLKQKANALQIEQQVKFHGKCNDVPQQLWNADIYVHGALTEGFGLVMVEAMAAGLPVISLDAGGNRDIITNDVNGYILAEHSADLFADKVLALANDKVLYQRIQNAGLQTAQQFDIVNYTEKLLALYRKQ